MSDNLLAKYDTKNLNTWVQEKMRSIIKLYQNRSMGFMGFQFSPKDLQEAYDAGFAAAEEQHTRTVAITTAAKIEIVGDEEEEEDESCHPHCCGADGAYLP